ncbi:hypothetical protein BDV25DRAFT_141047 [Aspergillus avenaceus]|uniref:Uncharacterized protein n=1 Tax=Aspergillus avenaceus TaxID=36643 RepID=A0A5N6TS85_ASPAV|nr:hypothetical protein BDV25DRAFT_141047 [Aspergillus avenaceus]
MKVFTIISALFFATFAVAGTVNGRQNGVGQGEPDNLNEQDKHFKRQSRVCVQPHSKNPSKRLIRADRYAADSVKRDKTLPIADIGLGSPQRSRDNSRDSRQATRALV